MEYINYIKAKTHIATATKSEKPVVSEEDENFLNQITKQENPSPLPPDHHGGDAQVALMAGAQNIPLPRETPNELTEEPRETSELTTNVQPEKKKKTWSWRRRDSRDSKREITAEGLHDIAEGLRSRPESSEGPVDAETKKEEEDMTIVLEKLNLAAVDNRVFSISDETQELLQKFNQVLKDLMNGVPTAYHDLESLLTNGDKQLQKTYNSLPPFLQKLIERLPQTMTKSFAPEIMAAASARASNYGINLEKSGKAAGSAAKFMKTPSLQDMVTKPGAVSGMLKSIMQFLKTRFPAFAGVNVLWSLALFLLLIVFWYCHKRGKEVRLDKEGDLTEQEVNQLETEWKEAHPEEDNKTSSVQPASTTAPPRATMEQVKLGMVEADAAEIAAASKAQASSQPEMQAQEPTAGAAVP